MAINPSSPVTGSAQTGFVGPTYTLTADVAPDINGKQHAVTAIGGTQAGVTAHSPASPFTVTFFRPKALKVLPVGSLSNSVIARVGKNAYKIITRKGVLPGVSQPPQIMPITTLIEVPAGSDTFDAANVRAAISAHIGYLNQLSAGIGDTTVSGIM